MKFILPVLVLVIASINISFASSADWSQATESHAKETKIDVHYSKTCGCCKKWMSHLNQHNFKVKPKPESFMDKIKRQHGVKGEYASCHTAIIGGYVIEGHVPADDIKRLLKEKPDIIGLSVPAMPVGTPGMEMGNKKDPFYVITLPKKGEPEIYHSYEKY